jgi:hypothetical protein
MVELDGFPTIQYSAEVGRLMTAALFSIFTFPPTESCVLANGLVIVTLVGLTVWLTVAENDG